MLSSLLIAWIDDVEYLVTPKTRFSERGSRICVEFVLELGFDPQFRHLTNEFVT